MRKYLLLVIILIPGVSLFGWLTGEHLFSSYSRYYIPAAPMTSLFFIISSLVLIANSVKKSSSISRKISVFILIIVILLCFLILLDRIFDFPWEIERIFLQNPHKWLNVIQGRMSPVSCILFIFSCIGIIGSIPLLRKTKTITNHVGGTSSLFVLLVSSVLLIGYLYRAPLLYGSQIIPVALPSAICFMFLGTFLLLGYDIRYWTFNLVNGNPVIRKLLIWFLPIAVGVVIFQGYLMTLFTYENENPALAAAIILLIVIIITIVAVFKIANYLGKRIHTFETALLDSEALLNILIHAIPDPVWMKDLNGKFLYCNKMFARLMGTREEEITGKTDYDFVDREKADFFCSHDLKAMQEGKPSLNEVSIIFRDDGHKALLETIKTPVYDSSGQIIGVLGIGHDITARKETEEELIMAKDRAEKNDLYKSAFLANMSHEIRTPMNGILGFAELLKDDSLSREEHYEYVKIIEESGNRMLNIINDIITFSKVESGKMPVLLSEVNINEILEFTYHFFRPEAGQKGIKLNYIRSLDPELTITTDREKVYAVLTNLVKNAIKFTLKGFIEIGCQQKEKNYIEFYVRDSGIGIPEDQKDTIFERFKRADDSYIRNTEGAGLGLSISRSYIEILEGKIWVESRYGEGSVFYFTLPARINENENKTNQQDGNDGQIILPLKRLKILIVEDDEMSYLLLAKTVCKYSREIIKVRTGIEALEACKNHEDIDLILMDIQIPEMDGHQTVRKIRASNDKVIIIAQTAFALSGDRDKAIAAGCNDYLSKPINQTKLINLIEKYFNQA